MNNFIKGIIVVFIIFCLTMVFILKFTPSSVIQPNYFYTIDRDFDWEET